MLDTLVWQFVPYRWGVLPPCQNCSRRTTNERKESEAGERASIFQMHASDLKMQDLKSWTTFSPLNFFCSFNRTALDEDDLLTLELFFMGSTVVQSWPSKNEMDELFLGLMASQSRKWLEKILLLAKKGKLKYNIVSFCTSKLLEASSAWSLRLYVVSFIWVVPVSWTRSSRGSIYIRFTTPFHNIVVRRRGD
jgi:hypothetical protein